MKNVINPKRLTKAQVKELINSNAVLHEQYTRLLEQEIFSGTLRDLVYRLTDGNFLYVFSPQSAVPGKGDIYSEDYILRLIRNNERSKQDSANRRMSSVGHWKFYSKNQMDILSHIDELVEELPGMLYLNPPLLDKSYKSLDAISAACENIDPEFLFSNCYDNLLAYVGEVIRKRINGSWSINVSHAGAPYPVVCSSIGDEYMVINAVWFAMLGLEPVNFRKTAADEIRLVARKAAFKF